jgi:hypothetical protein
MALAWSSVTTMTPVPFINIQSAPMEVHCEETYATTFGPWKVSVAFYLRLLMPFSVAGKGIFALLTVQTEPVSNWAAVPGLLVLIAVVLIYSCYRIRTLEIRYTTESS